MTFVSDIGFWTGLLVCVTLQSFFFLIFLYKLNWPQAAREVSIPCNMNDFLNNVLNVQSTTFPPVGSDKSWYPDQR